MGHFNRVGAVGALTTRHPWLADCLGGDERQIDPFAFSGWPLGSVAPQSGK